MSTQERFTGRVKWFNNRNGYGFITITDGPMSGKDVFVHHSSIKVDSEQYKYLVQGEYVDFSLLKTDGKSSHEFQAGEVCGIKGGKLMCETRRETRVARSQYYSTKVETTPAPAPSPVREHSVPKSVSVPKNEQKNERKAPRKQDQKASHDQSKEWTPVRGGKRQQKGDTR